MGDLSREFPRVRRRGGTLDRSFRRNYDTGIAFVEIATPLASWRSPIAISTDFNLIDIGKLTSQCKTTSD